jgi:hypothetical protein
MAISISTLARALPPSFVLALRRYYFAVFSVNGQWKIKDSCGEGAPRR